MRTLDTQAYLDEISGLLAQGHTGLPVPVAGTSMCPFLRNGDTVYLDPVTAPLQPGDVVLYTRGNGRYILHRVVDVRPNGIVMILGDNQSQTEPVPASRVIAIMTAACRKGKRIDPHHPVWRFYAGPWRFLAPWRKRIAALRNVFR